MFKSYLFIPANKKMFIEKSKTLNHLDHRVFDLEDSVIEADLDSSIKNLSSIDIKSSDWVRIPIEKNKTNWIDRINKVGIDKYVIPKFEGYSEFKNIHYDIISINPQAKMILLIENAKSYIDLEKILRDFNKSVYGVSLGIHDFTFRTGIKNDYGFLRNIRTNIMLLAQAFSVEPIDVVSMHLNNNDALTEEILDGFNSGYRAKFLIHPHQLDILNSVEFYSKEEIISFREVLNYYNKYIDGSEALFTYKDRVYEKMHIEKIKNIVEWGNEFYGTDR